MNQFKILRILDEQKMLLDNISDGAIIYQFNDKNVSEVDIEAGEQNMIRIKYTNNVLN